MLTILAITTPIYAIIALGFLAVRHGLFAQTELRVLGRFVVNICLPALLFRAMSGRTPAEVVHGRLIAVYAVASLLLLAGGTWLMKRWNTRPGQPVARAEVAAMGMCSSNSGFVGFPVAQQLLGAPAGLALALVMIVENLIVIPASLALAERAQRGSGSFRGVWIVVRGLWRNPLIIGIAVGLAVALLGVPVPEPLQRTVQILAAAATPTALFVIGGTLVGLNSTGQRGDLAAIAVGKLLVHPALVGLGFWLVPGIEAPLRASALVMAAAPMMSIYPVLALRFGLDRSSAAALLLATVASFFTLSGWLWAMHALLGWVN